MTSSAFLTGNLPASNRMKKILKMTLLVIGILIGLIVLLTVIFLNVAPQLGAKKINIQEALIQNSPHYKEGKFENIEPTVVMKKFELKTFSGYFTRGNRVPDWSIPVEKLPTGYFNNPDSLTRITWFGHSAMLLEMDGQKIFIDPMLGNVPSPLAWLGSKRFNDTLPLSIDSIPLLDAVIISHDHYDHLDYGSIIQINSKVKRYFVPLGLGSHLMAWGVEKEKISELNWWDTTSFEGIQLIATPARHFSGRGILDRNKTLWSSWVIQGKSSNIFFGGDSGYDQSFKKIGDLYGPFDFAMLECGQYNEQWPEIHMMPEEVVQANIDLKGKLLMPIHWGAFKLALHRWDEPVERMLAEAEKKNVRVATPRIGEPLIIGGVVPSENWWKK